jgi:hypothetical protein
VVFQEWFLVLVLLSINNDILMDHPLVMDYHLLMNHPS